MFEQVIGQHEVQERLLQLLREERLPHALMLCGPAGSGKMALAIGFAKELLLANSQQPTANSQMPNANSQQPTANSQQAMLAKLEHPDLHFTFPTIKLPSMGSDHKPVSDDFIHEWYQLLHKGLYFSISEWMDQMGGEKQQAIITAGESDALIRKLSLKSSQGGYKVSIIWLPERMNIDCANKILKLLEEPPAQTIFLLVCQEPDRLLETIRSRVQRIDVRKIDDESLRLALQEQRGLGEDMARRVTRMANGSWLKATELLSADTENDAFLELFQDLMRQAYMRNVKALKNWSETLAALGREKQKRFLEYFLRLIRENFMYNFHQEELCYLTQREEDFSKNFARFINETNILPICDLTDRAIRDIGQNANAKIVFFDFALQMIVFIKNAQ